MSTVAFLASVVDPRVASAAAKAALGKGRKRGNVDVMGKLLIKPLLKQEYSC